jgi:hypothetical protein
MSHIRRMVASGLIAQKIAIEAVPRRTSFNWGDQS